MGAGLLRHLYTSRTVLNKIRSLTGSQWSSLISGEVLSRLLAKKIRRADRFCILWRFFDVFGRDANKQRVTIVQSRCYQCANCLFTGVLVYETSNSCYIAKVVISRTGDGSNMRCHWHVRFKHNAKIPNDRWRKDSCAIQDQRHIWEGLQIVIWCCHVELKFL